MRYFHIPFSKLELSIPTVFKELGYGSSTPDNFVIEKIQYIFDVLRRNIITSCVFSIYDGVILSNSIKINNTIFDTGSIITSQLKQSTLFAVFIATAGHEFENKMQQAKISDDLFHVYLMDIIGNCIVEKTGDLMEFFLEKEISGLGHTYRFSPGYCNWKLTEQKKIFSLMSENPCKVSLSDDCLMYPIKSISGIIGIGQNVKRRQYTCYLCDLENCYKKELFDKRTL